MSMMHFSELPVISTENRQLQDGCVNGKNGHFVNARL
jgi:hypothetical protein